MLARLDLTLLSAICWFHPRNQWKDSNIEQNASRSQDVWWLHELSSLAWQNTCIARMLILLHKSILSLLIMFVMYTSLVKAIILRWPF